VNPRIKVVGEAVLRVKDLDAAKKFYTEVVGLDILREFDGITFLRVAPGHGGHTQIVGLFHASLPDPFGMRRGSLDADATSLQHFASEIDGRDYEAELQRLKGLGAEIMTFEHRLVSLAIDLHQRS
jgi:catechol 2,3-dioxygenase-like lactoylglutathione lyase family enzyme